MVNYNEIARYLLNAEKRRQSVACITNQYSTFDLEMGYRVQKKLIDLKVESGDKVTCYKMGLTSQAKMKQMKINEPIYGYIFDSMHLQNKAQIAMNDFIHPKVEAELAFIIGEDIEGPSVTTEEVLRKTQYIVPILEIIDSRYQDFTFTLPDVVADNTSASRVVFGDKSYRPKEYQIDSIEVRLNINGETRAKGVSSAVLGNPADSVAMLAALLWKTEGKKLQKGSVVLTGGITEAVMFEKGDNVVTEFVGMEDVSFSVI